MQIFQIERKQKLLKEKNWSRKMKTLKQLKQETKQLEKELERKLEERAFRNNLIRFLKDINGEGIQS